MRIGSTTSPLFAAAGGVGYARGDLTSHRNPRLALDTDQIYLAYRGGGRMFRPRPSRAAPPALLTALACAACAALAAAPLAGPASGHGIDVETVGPLVASGGGPEVSVSVEAAEDPDRPGAVRMTITALDDRTGEAAPGTVLDIALSRGGQEVARDRFVADADGTLRMVLAPPPDGAAGAEIAGPRGADGAAWASEPGRPVEVRGPRLGGPGLYTLDIVLAPSAAAGSADAGGSAAARADVSILEVAEYELADSEGEPVKFRTKSYFDAVSSLEYDPAAGAARLEMPFDWSDATISHIPVVHVEVHFPKEFGEFTSPSYTGEANGVPLFKSSVTVDDYTEEGERIVHFVLLGDHLRHVKSQLKGGAGDGELGGTMALALAESSESGFPMTAYTPGEELRVDLTWEPPEVEPGGQTSFIFTIRDGATGDPLRRSSYDFVIVQNGEEIYRAPGEAAVGGSFEMFAFSEGQTGPTIIRFEDIRGTGQSTEFALVVVPEFSAAALLVLAAAAAAAAVAAPALLRPGLRMPPR